MPSKKQIVAGLAAGVVVGGVVFALTRRSNTVQDDDTDFAPSTVPSTAAKVAEVPAAQPAQEVKAQSQPSPSPTASAQFTKEYSFRDTEANEKMLEEALQEQEIANKGTKSPAVADDGTVSFRHLGASLVPAAGWAVREEQTPMPNVAMISISKPEFAEKMQSGPEDMGSVPVIILSVEDISAQNLDLLEFKDKSKQMALQQMMAMTQGMIQPIMKFDDPLSVGPFRHCLEYGQSLPPYFDLLVSNLIAVHQGFAYVFQIMCSPKVMNQYKPIFMEMARSIKIFDTDGASVGHIEVQTGKAKVALNPTWTWSTEHKDASVITITTPSSVKSDEITIYASSSAPSVEAKSEKDIDGVKVSVVTSGRTQSKRFVYGDFVAIAKPLMKSEVFTPESEIVKCIKSVTLNADAESSTFVNAEHGYSVEIHQRGRLIASRAGGGTVVYAPTGLEESGPTVTIRVGDPESDGDCAEDLDGWEEKMRAEEAGGNINGLKRVTYNGHSCLTFVSKDMQEVAPGERTEMMGKVFIFVHNGKTVLIRWETTTGDWRKFEKKMEQLIASLKLL